MNYSISIVLHSIPTKDNLHKIMLRVIYKRKLVYLQTPFKVPLKDFKDGVIVKHANRNQINGILAEQKNQVEKNLIDAIKNNPDLSKEDLSEVVKGKAVSRDRVDTFITQLTKDLAGVLSDGRLRHYPVMATKLNEFHSDLMFKDISVKWMQDFERWLRKKESIGSVNTIRTNMSLLKGILSKAVEAGLIEDKQFKPYKIPAYSQGIANYLSEEEMSRMYDFIQTIDKLGHKLACYYFLLACMAGYRISDLKAFEYNKMVRNGSVMLRTTKTGSIVSIPVHSRLQQIFDYIHDKPLTLSEQKMREYVKEVAGFIGIKAPKIHDGRHSFAMLLMTKGFTIDEVAELIGDTPLIAKVYARVHNKTLNDKVMERLG